jgi:uncharacterized membrane protein
VPDPIQHMAASLRHSSIKRRDSVMKKERIEMLSDGVFAIVMTLLVLDIKLPESEERISNAALWQQLSQVTPSLTSYFLSFIVLAVFWQAHHALYHFVVGSANRQLLQFNMLYLSFLSLIPFSAKLLGMHPDVPLALRCYGLNILAIAAVNILMMAYVLRTPEIRNERLPPKIARQGRVRLWLNVLFSVLGIAATWLSLPLAIALFAFPVLFNIIPGTLTLTEKLLRIEI